MTDAELRDLLRQRRDRVVREWDLQRGIAHAQADPTAKRLHRPSYSVPYPKQALVKLYHARTE